ncbi:hypothetical protein F2Q65_16660 [Thiohalocapsa marina]|uniref:DUF11 domain-containing protein n=1 Tax=Thiohalocapsa marina TaxID=424902 RepID=A0A5M8FQ93_9GAMM|nr:hypothetical protein [Thiohalocapsa marina]KAA6183052.1 hypothetical protein F2Q65_16660 [Thiohalocapsa marina]
MLNRVSRLCIVFPIITAALTPAAWAGSTASQTIRYSVEAFAQISVSGSPAPLQVMAAEAGAAPTPAVDASTSYAVSTNGGADTKKITAALSAPLPHGLTLEVELASPGGGAVANRQTLTTTPADVVTHIGSLAATGNAITYRLSASAEAGPVDADSVTVTYTITNQI